MFDFVVNEKEIELNNKDFIMVLGKPAVGKSTFVLKNIENSKTDKKILYFSLECNKEELLKKYPFLNNSNIEIISDKNEEKDIIDIISNNENSLVYIDYLNLINETDNIINSLVDAIKKYNIGVLSVVTISSQSSLEDIKNRYLSEEYKEVNNIFLLIDRENMAKIK